jgi:hypothetical protein
VGTISKFIFALDPEMSYTGPGIDGVSSLIPLGNGTHVKEHLKHSRKGCFEIWNFYKNESGRWGGQEFAMMEI